MNPTIRQKALAVLLVFALLLVLYWSYERSVQAHQQATDSTADLANCRQLAKQIKAIQDQPTRANEEEMLTQELAKRIESASKKADLPLSQLVRITPSRAMRIGETVYMQKPTRIDLRSVGLSELVVFLHELSTGPNAFLVHSLRLSPPHEAEQSELWNTEITLTYLIYSPRQENSSGGATP